MTSLYLVSPRVEASKVACSTAGAVAAAADVGGTPVAGVDAGVGATVRGVGREGVTAGAAAEESFDVADAGVVVVGFSMVDAGAGATAGALGFCKQRIGGDGGEICVTHLYVYIYTTYF